LMSRKTFYGTKYFWVYNFGHVRRMLAA